MLKKSFLLVLSVCFLLGMATKAEVEGVKEEAPKDTVADTLTQPENKTENGYRIEVVKVKLRGEEEEEIRFISPEGNVTRTIPYATWEDRARITVSPDSRYLLQSSVLSGGLEEKNPEIEISFINAKGENRWSKSFEVEYMLSQTHEDDQMPYFFKISRDGSTIAFIRSHDTYKKDWWSDIIVFDTLGNEIASVSHVLPQMEGSPSDFEVSPDGKIICATVFPQLEDEPERRRYLFFLDVETGETKMVQAEGDGWGVSIILSENQGEDSDKILLILRKGYKPDEYTYESIYLTFHEIPKDLSTFLKGKE